MKVQDDILSAIKKKSRRKCFFALLLPVIIFSLSYTGTAKADYIRTYGVTPSGTDYTSYFGYLSDIYSQLVSVNDNLEDLLSYYPASTTNECYATGTFYTQPVASENLQVSTTTAVLIHKNWDYGEIFICFLLIINLLYQIFKDVFFSIFLKLTRIKSARL